LSEKNKAGRLILRGAQATALGFVARLGARLIFLFVAGRLFGASAFGSYVLAVALVELGVSLGGLSTKNILFQLLDRRPDGRHVPHLLVDTAILVVLASLGLSAAIMIGAWLVPRSMLSEATATAFFVLAPMVAGQALLDLLLAATRWKHAVRYEVVGRNLIEPYGLIAGALAAFALGWGEHGLLIGYWCGTLAALVFALAGVRRSFGPFRLAAYRPRRGLLADTVRAAAPTTAGDFLSALYIRLDLYLVGILLGEGPAGLYGMARQISVPVRQVRQSFDGLLIPMVSRTLALSGSRATGTALASATRLILVIQLAMIVTLLAIGRPLLEWLGPGFGAAYWPLVMLASAEAMQSAFGMGDLIFVYLRPRIGLYLTMIGIACGVAAALLLIPALGLAGAALAVLAAYSVRTALRSYVLRTRFHVAVPHDHHAGPLLAAAFAAGIVLLTQRLEGLGAGALYPLTFVAGLAAYAAAILLWLLLSRQSLGLTGFLAEAQPDDRPGPTP
jgi:O-antigen/teichoic acid export membrane protein